MSTSTTYFGLVKPSLTDAADITAMNGNWDTIDQNLVNPLKPVAATSTDGVVYTATINGITELYTGLEIIIIPNIVSTTISPKLNLNNFGEKSIKMKLDFNTNATTTPDGNYDTSKKWISAGKPLKLTYEGSVWESDIQRTSSQGFYGTLDVEKGGTGGNTAEEARNNLGITTLLDDKASVLMVNDAEGRITELEDVVDISGGRITIGEQVANTSKNSTVSGYRNNVTGSATETLTSGSSVTGGFNAVSGIENTVSGSQCVVGGKWNNIISANQCAAFGRSNTVDSGVHQAMLMGFGLHATSTSGSGGTFYCGRYNDSTKESLFVVGKGTAASASNAFRVRKDATVYGGTYNSSGADYAEYFEWEDGNVNNEIRKGRFVTLSESGKKIRYATENDSFILGIISTNASIIGNAAEEEWHGKYLTNVYGEYVTDDDGELILSSNYDDTKEYIPRSERPEWSVVGLLGQIIMDDDGTCIPGKFCSPSNDGIATLSETGYRVLERIDDTHIKVLFK